MMKRFSIVPLILLVLLLPLALFAFVGVMSFRRAEAGQRMAEEAHRAEAAVRLAAAEEVAQRYGGLPGEIPLTEDEYRELPGNRQPDTLDGARKRYAEAERAVQALARQLHGPATGFDEGADPPRVREADRAALRNAIARAFAARQDLLKLELADYRQRVDRLAKLLDDRHQGRDAVIEGRLEELLNPNLRWDAPSKGLPGANKNAVPGTPTVGVGEDKAEGSPGKLGMLNSLMGTWLAVKQGSNGQVRDFKADVRLTLTFARGNRYSFREGNAESYSNGEFTIVHELPYAPVCSLDLTRTYLRSAGGPKGSGQLRVEYAIAEVEGDTLRMCWGGNKESDRPGEFSTSEGDGRLLMIYRRVDEKNLPILPGASGLPGLPSSSDKVPPSPLEGAPQPGGSQESLPPHPLQPVPSSDGDLPRPPLPGSEAKDGNVGVIPC